MTEQRLCKICQYWVATNGQYCEACASTSTNNPATQDLGSTATGDN